MQGLRGWRAMALALTISALAPAMAGAVKPRTELVSKSATGKPGNGVSATPAISADGGLVAFWSAASNLVSGVSGGQVFAQRRSREKNVLVSARTDGTPPPNNGGALPAVSADGSTVAFESQNDQLVASGSSLLQVYSRDLSTSVTRMASVDSNGTPGNQYSDNPALSGDGRFVAFSSSATNLTPTPPVAPHNEFVHDFQTGETQQVNLAASGAPSDGYCHNPTISADGRYVAFTSNGDDLVDGVSTRGSRVYVRDLVGGQTILASRGAGGQAANGFHPAISGDGRFVAFDSKAQLVRGDDDKNSDVYVRDLKKGKTVRVSVNAHGNSNGASADPSISNHGGYVAFASLASNLTPGLRGHKGEIFLADLRAGKMRLVSSDVYGLRPGDPPAISADGRFVTFAGLADKKHLTPEIFAVGPFHR